MFHGYLLLAATFTGKSDSEVRLFDDSKAAGSTSNSLESTVFTKLFAYLVSLAGNLVGACCRLLEARPLMLYVHVKGGTGSVRWGVSDVFVFGEDSKGFTMKLTTLGIQRQKGARCAHSILRHQAQRNFKHKTDAKMTDAFQTVAFRATLSVQRHEYHLSRYRPQIVVKRRYEGASLWIS